MIDELEPIDILSEKDAIKAFQASEAGSNPAGRTSSIKTAKRIGRDSYQFIYEKEVAPPPGFSDIKEIMMFLS